MIHHMQPCPRLLLCCALEILQERDVVLREGAGREALQNI
jgi:hypothetical protein